MCEIRGLNSDEPLRLGDLRQWEVSGMRGVAVRCIDIAENSGCEGS